MLSRQRQKARLLIVASGKPRVCVVHSLSFNKMEDYNDKIVSGGFELRKCSPIPDSNINSYLTCFFYP